MRASSCLSLRYGLPTRQKAVRMVIWRRLKNLSSTRTRTPTCLLPNNFQQREHFQLAL
jgi:hypothetical protein